MNPVIVSLGKKNVLSACMPSIISVRLANLTTFSKLTAALFKARSLCAVPFPGHSLPHSPAPEAHLVHHFLGRACQRTPTAVSITLHCDCLFTHLFPQLDSELPEVGNLLLFNFAASCWLQGSPEPERWPTLSKYVTL